MKDRSDSAVPLKHGANKRRVLLIYRELIPSIRLCGHCQMEYLAARDAFEYRASQEKKLRAADIKWADIVLLGRLDSWYEYRLAMLAREAGKYIVYIIDDDLLNIPPQLSSAEYYGRKDIQGYIRDMIGLSDAILSPSPLLLRKYARDGRLAIQIEEPAIDPIDYRPHDPGKPVKIGFAGSIDRIGDIEALLKDALLQVKGEYGDRVAFEFFGAIPSFAEELDARCVPYCDSYDSYRKTLNELEWDIGLAPMPDTPFHACKHYNKFSEYAAAGIVGIFSEVYPYTRIRQFPECFVLCENRKDRWREALEDLIDDPVKREEYRKRALECTGGSLSVEESAQALMALENIELSAVAGKKLGNARMMAYRIIYYSKRLISKIRDYGVAEAIKALAKK